VSLVGRPFSHFSCSRRGSVFSRFFFQPRAPFLPAGPYFSAQFFLFFPQALRWLYKLPSQLLVPFLGCSWPLTRPRTKVIAPAMAVLCLDVTDDPGRCSLSVVQPKFFFCFFFFLVTRYTFEYFSRPPFCCVSSSEFLNGSLLPPLCLLPFLPAIPRVLLLSDGFLATSFDLFFSRSDQRYASFFARLSAPLLERVASPFSFELFGPFCLEILFVEFLLFSPPSRLAVLFFLHLSFFFFTSVALSDLVASFLGPTFFRVLPPSIRSLVLSFVLKVRSLVSLPPSDRFFLRSFPDVWSSVQH